MSSLYLHIPFCSSKCPYCDFFSQVGTQRQLDRYVELLKRNIEIVSQGLAQPASLNTIFFGGGTPSLLSAPQFEDILNLIDRSFKIQSTAEITVEANPGTLNLSKLKGFRHAGVNRLSLGIQSLNDRSLRLLGRIHSASLARESIVAARTAGFDNINLDLMFALPEQNMASLEVDISALLEFEPEHVSLYGLSFEEGTEYSARQQSGQLKPCGEELYADQYMFLHHHLLTEGYEHYEISNFAKANRRCNHNQVYWQRKNCLAIGAGAHGFLDQEWGTRWHIPADMCLYEKLLLQGNDPVEILERYDHSGAMKEYVYLALRTSNGVNLQEFHGRFGVDFHQVFAEAIHKMKRYLRSSNDHCCLDIEGWLIYDHLISHFL
ncbi:radical SAM family heme chaperone HemW [uncultured Desulfuromusa sp.]|uniref:radical SAM family heme chaperone HemW n=1 Tax=uncultured Desulfuromusa sp. TaxID=219183 RepID=UPI002AA80331|nr:radical SAM family heme chaperone HemW [uncultured Desulfuromusa sp.]